MKWFRKEEFRCICCGQLPCEENIEALVVNVLDPARERLELPIKVNSGYRCPKHNAEVGGAVRSQHLKGEAADIHCANNERLAEIIIENGNFDQIIIYPTFIHVSYKRLGINRNQVLTRISQITQI